MAQKEEDDNKSRECGKGGKGIKENEAWQRECVRDGGRGMVKLDLVGLGLV